MSVPRSTCREAERRSRRLAAFTTRPQRWLGASALAAYLTLGSRAPARASESAGAAGETRPARQDQQPVRRWDIAPGPLVDALHAFEEAAQVTLVRPAAGLEGFTSPGASGVLTAEQALAQLLGGTGITFRVTRAGAMRLEVRATESVQVTSALLAAASPKYTEPLRDVPQTITVVPRAVIEEQNATTLRDVLRNVPGITIQAGEGGVPAGDNLSIRGFSARTDIFVDGVRDFGGYSRDPYNVEQVEVAKGPASSYTGRGSTGGAVNLVSKTPQAAPVRTLAVGAGNVAYKRVTVDVNQPIDADALGLRGVSFRFNGMFTGTDVARRDAVDNRRFGLSPSLAVGLGTPTRVVLSYSHLDQDNTPDYGIPWVPAGVTGPLAAYAGGRPPVDSANFYGLLARDYEETATGLATAAVEHDFTPRLTLRHQLRYGRNDRDSVITAPRFVNASSPTQYSLVNRQLQSRDMTDTILSNQTTLTARFGAAGVDHAVVAGLEWGREQSTNHLRSGPQAPVADLFDPDPGAAYPGPITRTGAVNDGEADSLAAFLFDTVRIGSRVELLGGLRFDRFAIDYSATPASGAGSVFGRTDEMLSWRAGAVYKPRPHGSLYAGLGTSFNPSAEGLSLAANNASLEPEKTVSYELGSKWDLFANRLSLTGALFRTEKTNARTPGVNAGDPPLVLAGEQIVNGVEIGAYGVFAERATLFAGYAHMSSQIEVSNTPAELGQALAQTPEHTFNLWLTLRLPGRVTLGGGVQYMDSVYRNAANTLEAPSYWLANATAAVELGQRLTLRMNAYNLADEEYVDRVGGGHFIPGPGRYGMLTLDWRF